MNTRERRTVLSSVGVVLIAVAMAGITMHVRTEDRERPGAASDIKVSGQEIAVSPEAARKLRLQVMELRPSSEPVILGLTGKTAFNMERVVHVKVQFPGKLMTIGPALGTEVKGPAEGPEGKATVLCTVQSIDLGSAKNAYQKAVLQLELDLETQQRTKELVDAKVLADRFLEEADAALTKDKADVEVARQNLFVFGVKPGELDDIARQKPIERMAYDIHSPISGWIVEKNVTRGEYADSTINLYTIAETSTMWVWGDVYEKDWDKVKAGQKMKVLARAYPEHPYESTIDMIAPALDPTTRGIRVRGTVENRDRRLLADMYCKLSVTLGDGQNSLVAPSDAVVRGLQAGEAYAFVRRGAGAGEGGVFERRPVRVEELEGSRVRFLEGVAGGETITVRGASALGDEMRRK